MSASFTPGPYIVHPLMAWVSPAADIDTPVCLLRDTPGEIAQSEVRANARLIAAAPDLFAIGQKLLEIFDHPTRHVTQWDADELRAALAKATGADQ